MRIPVSAEQRCKFPARACPPRGQLRNLSVIFPFLVGKTGTSSLIRGDPQTVNIRPQGSLAPETSPADRPRSVDVLGVPLGLTDYNRTLDWIDATVSARGRGYICVCNVHTVMASAEDPELRSALLD